MIRGLASVALLAGMAAIAVPELMTAVLKRAPETAGQPVSAEAASAVPPLSAASKVRLDADVYHHYSSRFRINGRSTDGLIDTGATLVALNETTARRLGILPVHYQGKIAVNTANGPVTGSGVVIDRIEIGSIAVRNISAVVLPDTALGTTLIGMSFLSKLRSYSVSDDTMELVR